MTNEPTIEMASGRYVTPLNLQTEQVSLYDIAHHLAMKVRFTGAVKAFYSVAQHSVAVSQHPGVTALGPRWALAALLHDANEAYLTDVPSPVKPHVFVRGDSTSPDPAPMPRWKEGVEKPAQLAIYEAFRPLLTRGTYPTKPEWDLAAARIHEADVVVRHSEAQFLLPSGGTGEHWDWPEGTLADKWSPAYFDNWDADWPTADDNGFEDFLERFFGLTAELLAVAECDVSQWFRDPKGRYTAASVDRGLAEANRIATGVTA